MSSMTCAPLKKMHENEVLLNLPSGYHYGQIIIALVSAVLLVVALCVCVHVRMYFVCICVSLCWGMCMCVCGCVMVYVVVIFTEPYSLHVVSYLRPRLNAERTAG